MHKLYLLVILLKYSNPDSILIILSSPTLSLAHVIALVPGTNNFSNLFLVPSSGNTIIFSKSSLGYFLLI